MRCRACGGGGGIQWPTWVALRHHTAAATTTTTTRPDAPPQHGSGAGSTAAGPLRHERAGHTDALAHPSPRSRVEEQQQQHRHRPAQPSRSASGGVTYGDEYFEMSRAATPVDDRLAVFPGAELPPLQPQQATRFSFLAHPSQRQVPDYTSNHIVPNNTPKPLLPMWASSLTSPTLGKQRIVEDNWIYLYASGGDIEPSRVEAFVQWAVQRMGGADPSTAPAASPLVKLLREHVEVRPRATYTRGLYAKRSFRDGETVLVIPLEPPPPSRRAGAGAGEGTSGGAPLWGMMLNSESMKQHSAAAQRRGVPAYHTVAQVLGRRKSSFDPVPHPLFIDQVHLALFLACERAEGPASPLHPYLSLLAPFDDDYINELHLGVLDPPTHLELKDQRQRFEHYIREIHMVWTERYELAAASPTPHAAPALPPPSFHDMLWALRVVLSRQKLLTGLREFQDPFLIDSSDRNRMEQLDPFARAVSRAHRFLYEKVLRVVPPGRLKVNDFNPSTIACVVPFLDMLQHDPSGEGNTAHQLHLISLPSAAPGEVEAEPTFPAIVLTAQGDIDEGDELTTTFTRCYSLAYTLYRYGFLPLRSREADQRDLAEALQEPGGPEALGEPLSAHHLRRQPLRCRHDLPVMKLGE